jgi:N utilization substance protein B
MPSRRQIREAVVQFLFCADLEGGAHPAELREPFWQFVTESDRKALALAVWKSLRHFAAGRDARHAELTHRLPEALRILALDPACESGSSLLKYLSSLENDWAAKLKTLSTIRRDGDPDVVTEQFTAGLASLFAIDRDLARARSEFLQFLDDRPSLQPPLEPIAATLRRLGRISERIRQLEHPEDYPDQSDLKKILSSKSSIRELREKSDRIVDGILRVKDQLDSQLREVIENFAPERVDPVDRAILRLGTWEILHDPEVPKPVAINEAVELAKKFGTSDSGRFVNGVLDRIARA